MKPISDILQKCVFENTTCSFVHFGFSHSKSIEFETYFIKNFSEDWYIMAQWLRLITLILSAVVAEIVEPPAYGPEYDWLWVVKYIGYAVSIVMLLVFITVVFINPFLWEMFHIIRCNSAFCIFAACLCMFVAENSTIRKDRHDNITVSVFQQYWFLASSLSLLSESFATFRAITGLLFIYMCQKLK